MIKKIKVLNANGLTICPLPDTGRPPFSIQGMVMSAWFLSSNQAIVLHEDGVLWLPKSALQVLDDDNQGETKESVAGSLRGLIGQDMKNVSFEFK